MTSSVLTPADKRGPFTWERWLFCGGKGGRVRGSPSVRRLGTARGSPCPAARGSHQHKALLTTKTPLSPNRACAVCDFRVALGARFMFNGSLREEQTSLPLLCAGLFGEGSGPRAGEVVWWLLLSASLPHTLTDCVWPLWGENATHMLCRN